MNVEKLNGPHAAFFPVNRDCAINDRGRYLDFPAAEAYKRLLVSRHVELGRENAVGWSRGELSVGALQSLQRPAVEAAGSARPTLRLFRWTLRFEQSFDPRVSDQFGLQ